MTSLPDSDSTRCERCRTGSTPRTLPFLPLEKPGTGTSHQLLARSPPGGESSAAGYGTGTGETAQLCTAQREGTGHLQGGARAGVSLTWQWSTSAGERDGGKAGTDPFGFPVRNFSGM